MNLNEYKIQFIKRYDDNKLLHYFTGEDFPTLHQEKFSFISNHNDVLSGYTYYYDNYNEEKVIIFCHGIGGGHLSYLKEIEYLAKKGFFVITYDMTGCFSSHGKDSKAMTQALSDLNSCIEYIKGNNKYCNKELIVIGHSLGAYASSNIASFQKRVRKIVAISPFISINRLIMQLNNTLNSKDSKDIYNYEKSINPSFVNSTALKALSNNSVEALIIHSIDDEMVNYKLNYKYLSNRIKNKNVKFMLVDKKGHNPNYSLSAVEYMKKTFKDYYEKNSSNYFSTFLERVNYFSKVDWNLMTEQDDDVMLQIINFICEK